MKIIDQVQLIKKLHLAKGHQYLIFVDDASGLTGEDLEKIRLPLGYTFVLCDGNPNNLVKVIEVKDDNTHR